MAMNIEKFTKTLYEKADKTGFGKGKCALRVRLALKDGGYAPTTWPELAKDWGPSMLRAGFHEITVDDVKTFMPMKGDVAVIQATAHHSSGHIQGYDGKTWVSDFVQRRGFWPGEEYRNEKPKYVIYRP